MNVVTIPRALVTEPELIFALQRLERDLADPTLGVDSLMVVRDGAVIFERWWRRQAAEMPHETFSVTKTLTATAVGVAIDRGLLNIDEPVRAFFGDEGSGIDETISVRHLLTMSSGRVADDSNVRLARSTDAVATFAGLGQRTIPGSTFAYCSLTSHLLSLIIRSRVDATLLEYLLPSVFEPLGIATPAWDTDLDGNQVGGVGLHLTTEDIVKIGLLFQGRGIFGDRRVFSEAWHLAATSAQIDTKVPGETRGEWTQGYGFQMWRGLHNTYRADGMLGQFSIVAPQARMTIATTARSKHTERMLAHISRNLLRKPNMTEALTT